MARKSETENFENNEPSACKNVELVSSTEDIVRQIPTYSEVVDISPNIRVANEVFHSWRKCKPKMIFQKLKAELEMRSSMIANIIVNEIGINYQEAMSDLIQGISIIETAMYTVGRNTNIEEFSDDEYHRETRKPLGIIAAILPYSSLVTTIMRTVVPALATGNCVIVKPSQLTLRTIECITECVVSAGVPSGVFQVLPGSMAVVHALCTSPDVAAVSFFGSSAEAQVVFNRCVTAGKRVLAFGGAKNHVLALPDCDVQTTVQDIVAGFTACAGQRCLAVSVLILVSDGSESMQKAFMDSLVAEIVTVASRVEAGQKIGQFGPLINGAARDRVIEYINEAEAAGCKILLDGRSWATERTTGYWVGPTIILHSNASDRAMKEEIFGPVLSVYCATSWDEAITIENSNPYGTATSVYTERGAHAEWFVPRLRAGMIGVNECFPPNREPTYFSPADGSLSKFGSHELTGDRAMDFFTSRVHVTARWVAPNVGTAAAASPARVVCAPANASPTNTRRRGLVPIVVPQTEELPPVGPVRRTSSCTTKDLLLREDSTMTFDSEGDVTVDQNEQPPSASKPAAFRGIAATSPFASSDSQFDFNLDRIQHRDDSFEPCYSAQPSVEFDPRVSSPFERGISDISAVSNISNTLSRENSVVLQQSKKYFNVDLCATQDIHEAHLTAVQTLVTNIGPLETQYTYRASATRFVKKHLRKSLQCSVIETGMTALRCFLPTDPIKLSVILSGRLEPHWQNIARDGFARMQNEAQDTAQQPTTTENKHISRKLDIQKQGNDCKLSFLCDMTEVEISLNARNDVCLLAFFEEVDNLVGQDSLFKRSILLIRAWWEYETAEYFDSPATRQLLNESAICVMVCAIFNQHHTRIQSPLQALCLFLAEYSAYDGTTEVITLQGIVPFRSLDSHQLTLSEPSKKHLVSSTLLDKYWKVFQVEDVIRSRTSSCTSTSIMGSPLRSSDSVSAHTFIRDSFNVLHPFDGSNMVKAMNRAPDRKFPPSKLNRAFLEGAKNLSYALSKQVPASTGSSELIDLFMPATKARFSLPTRPDTLPTTSTDTSEAGPSSPSRSSMAVSVDKLWQSIHYCNFIIKSVVTESAILTFCFDVLSMFGLLTADDLGKRLNDASKVPQVMVTLKEQVGGLKEFLKRYPDVFVFSYEHPYNPHVFLRMTLTTELQVEVENGILPVKFLTHIISKFGRILPPPPKVDSPGLRRGKVMMQQAPLVSHPSSALYAVNSGIVDERAVFGHERSADGDALRLMQSDVDLASVNDALNTPTSKESDTSSLDKASTVSASGPHNPYAPAFVPQQQSVAQRALDKQSIPVRKTTPLGASQQPSLRVSSPLSVSSSSPYYGNDLGLISSAVLGSGVSLSIGSGGNTSGPVISSSSSVCSSNSRLQYSDTDMLDGFLDSNSDYFGDSLGTSGHNALLSSLRDNSKEFSDMMLSDDYSGDINLGVLSNSNNHSHGSGSNGYSNSSDLYGSGTHDVLGDGYHQAGSSAAMRGHAYPAQQAQSNPELYHRGAGMDDYGHDGYGGYRDTTQHGGGGYMYSGQSQGPGQLHYGNASNRSSLMRTNSRPLLIPPQSQLGANNQKFQHRRYDVSSQYKK